MTYPLQAIQLSLISSLTIGIPSFFLAMEPNYGRVKGHFMKNVLRKALPGGLTNLILILLAGFCCSVFHISDSEFSTIAVWVVSTVGFVTLYYVCVPFTNLRILVFSTMLVGMILALTLFQDLLMMVPLSSKSIMILALIVLSCPTVMRVLQTLLDPSQLKAQKREKGGSIKDIFKFK